MIVVEAIGTSEITQQNYVEWKDNQGWSLTVEAEEDTKECSRKTRRM